jgi:hypothetical protein
VQPDAELGKWHPAVNNTDKKHNEKWLGKAEEIMKRK